MPARRAWLAAAAAIAAVAAIAVVSARSWNAIDADISLVGWLAMGFGVLFALALGIGLTALMFYSSRHGYDDAVHGGGADVSPVSPPGAGVGDGHAADSTARPEMPPRRVL